MSAVKPAGEICRLAENPSAAGTCGVRHECSPDSGGEQTGGRFDDMRPPGDAVHCELQLFTGQQSEIGQARTGKVQNGNVSRCIIRFVIEHVIAVQGYRRIAGDRIRPEQSIRVDGKTGGAPECVAEGECPAVTESSKALISIGGALVHGQRSNDSRVGEQNNPGAARWIYANDAAARTRKAVISRPDTIEDEVFIFREPVGTNLLFKLREHSPTNGIRGPSDDVICRGRTYAKYVGEVRRGISGQSRRIDEIKGAEQTVRRPKSTGVAAGGCAQPSLRNEFNAQWTTGDTAGIADLQGTICKRRRAVWFYG